MPLGRCGIYGECADVGGGVLDAPCRRNETPYRAVEDAGPYGECADVGGGVPDAPCQRTETPCRAVEDAGPYGECAAPTGNALALRGMRRPLC